jgi:PKD repeat protein
MGIYRVQLAGMDTTTAGSTDGYGNYACRPGPVLQHGATYTLAVHTNPSVDETVRAWIDFDGNGQFAASELVLSSTALQHQGVFTVPATAQVGLPLRLRIAADYVNAPIPTACSSPQYSQTEDYSVRVVSTALPRPIARFVALDSVSCGGAVLFQDQSRNSPTAWNWHFGDGTTSNQQHPQHVYVLPGTYAVQLRVCNATGCDSLAKSGYVLVRADAPRPAPCQPATTAYCCNFGLTRVRLAGLDHASVNGAAGYEDFSCAHQATLTAGQPAVLQLATGANAQDVRVYLDLNDNGQFDLPSEALYQGVAVLNPAIPLQLAVGAGVVYHRPLRLRLWVDAAGVTVGGGPCTSPQQGQVEDYAVVVLPNLVPPVAQFALAYTQFCSPLRVALTNTTTGASRYVWDFGDGTPQSTATTPPDHEYAQPGTYELTLVGSNAFGTDTLRRTVVVAPCPGYCPADGYGGNVDSPSYFTRVQVASLDNADARGPGVGYRDYTARYTEMQQGQTYTLRAESLPWQFSGNGPWVRVTAWIDYNQDGVFEIAERVGQVSQFSPFLLPFQIPLTARAGATRLRVQIVGTANPVGANISCPPAYWVASTEDYTVVIAAASVAPVANLGVNISPSCSGIVQFQDSSSAAPTRWAWNFGDGTSSTQQHPQHSYAAPGNYAVSLRVSNPFGASTASQAVTIAALAQAPRPAACVPPVGTVSSDLRELSVVALDTWTYSNPQRFAGYVDETCAMAPLSWVTGAVLPVTVREPNANRNVLAPRWCQLWLDADDDGVFTASERILVLALSGYGPVWRGSLTVPAGALPNRPLRLRVWWEHYNGLTFDGRPCGREEEYGQVRDFTVVVSARPTATTGGDKKSAAWTLFPNPAVSQVTLATAFGGEHQVRVELYESTGRLVGKVSSRTNARGEAVLDLPSLPAGLYLVRLAGELGVRRLIKQE